MSSAYAGAASSISYSHPAASAPAAKQANILVCSSRSESDSTARIAYCSLACPGMTLTACPPSVTMPCTICPGANCCRSTPIATCATVTASAALTPRCGATAACDSLPR
ncbi:Uncharacterised protein [Mycobacterium tuberculosis]|uniref:Uncharacterized protein n=1 Tax=Mycobacterium tuberculosis TaxID=1773 RepID=A0A0U0SKC0_MYCTX|nr:Uncharacterised protein [Mycobacterium tuberculosis]